MGGFDPDCDARHIGKVAKQEKQMHSLRTIIKINKPVAEPTRTDISAQAKWMLSLLSISERSQFISSGRLPDVQRKLSASRGVDVPLLEASALVEALKWKPQQH